MTPAPQPVPFAARQQALAAYPGRPLDEGTLSSLRRTAPAVRSPVSVVTPGYRKDGAGAQSFSPQTQLGGTGPRQPAVRQGAAPQPSRQPQLPAGQIRRPVQPSRQPQQPAGQVRTPVQPSRQPAGQVRTPVQPSRQPNSQQRQTPAGSRSKILEDQDSAQ